MAFFPWLFPEKKESGNHCNLENWRYMTQSTEFLHKPLIIILIWDSMRTLCFVKILILLLILTECLVGIEDFSLGPLFFRCDEEIDLIKIWCRDYVSRQLRRSLFPSPFYNHENTDYNTILENMVTWFSMFWQSRHLSQEWKTLW